ncbi:AMP-binding protein [Prosthecobacter vanneervenii]|uniref:Acyl-CoA synthetase (AMP-forming)/AMP-acid ligase II n=1 Tax=Prosthecobacter vanneervenii TaxID=48466 RepID=A0A7W7YF88_9BACT|nr:AMP-binding protein [Prosthecobacter vanneervenii]MBB5034947.1 acyl-CoA synthetase (AMP-forming)/AMP-acid ligase II [Prosthecobacter vanneervenii]
MFGERWERIVKERGAQAALYLADGRAITFCELDEEARALRLEGDYVLAQGDVPQILRQLLAGFLHGIPVQLVEKDRARRVPACPPPAGTALIKQAVGGSGMRRCQFFTFEQIAADVDRLHAALDLGARGVGVAAISCAHSFGLTMTVLQTLLHGVPTCHAPQPFAQPLMDAMRPHARVFLPGVPALWKAWLTGNVGFANVSLALSAGAPLTLDLERLALEKHGLKIHNLYGASECGAVSWDDTPGLREDASDLGRLLPGVEAQPDANGCLVVHSSSVGLGYDEPQPQEQYGTGAFTTCDQIEVQEGHLRFRQSTGAGINVAGRKLSPAEIAEKIMRASGLPQVKIHGVKSRDPERCQDIVAELELPQAEIDAAFKIKACSLLAPWEVPRKWIGKL